MNFVTWSGGKDSCYAMMRATQLGVYSKVLLNMMNEKLLSRIAIVYFESASSMIASGRNSGNLVIMKPIYCSSENAKSQI
jgi:diphthamide synthase (EF-2-diphthine--ammonia ligase)